jgi:hypothetical protein
MSKQFAKQILFCFCSRSQSNRTEIINLSALIILWVLMAFFVNPWGNFPLDDDWIYGKAVQSIIEEKNFTLSGGNSSANLVVQAFLGALFCLPFGFSFTALRFCTLFLGLIGILATYSLLRQVKASQSLAFLGALLIALNPIYFGLSNTFMTDVPFFALATLSLYLLVRGFEKNSRSETVSGLLLSYFSILIRQNGITIPFAFSCAYLVKKGLTKKSIITAIFTTILGLLVHFSYQEWLELTNRTTPGYNLHVNRLIKIILSGDILSLIPRLIDNTFVALIYLGLFLSPLLIFLFLKRLKSIPLSQKKLTLLFTTSTFLALIIWLLRMKGRPMPLSKNILVNFGIGPLTLHDTYILKLNLPLTSIYLKIVWLILTVIGVIGACLLIYYLSLLTLKFVLRSQQPQWIEKKWFYVLVVAAILSFYLPLGIEGYFDRYLLFLLPLLMMAVVICSPHTRQFYMSLKGGAVTLLIMLVCGVFTLGSTHDYLSWNRIRWQALNELTQESQILPNDIDGGYEFNGWYLYSPDYKRKPDKSWWWVDRDDYIISFGPLRGYQEVKRYSFERLLPFGPKNILILSKKT